MARKRTPLRQIASTYAFRVLMLLMALATTWPIFWLIARNSDPEFFYGRYVDRQWTQFTAIAMLLMPVVAIFVFWAIRHRNQDEVKRREFLSDTKFKPTQITTQALEDRISQLSRASFAIYWTMLLVLLGGLVLIIFSGYLSSFDSVSSNLLTRLDRQQADLNMRMQSAREFADIPSMAADGQRILAGAQQEYMRIASQRELVLRAMLETMKSRDQSGTGINLSGTLLRVCIIGLLIFLVQILVQLYRYNSRLIAFYSSRRDALLMSDGEPEKLETLTRLFAPIGLDFGRSPTHPLQEISGFFSRGRRPEAGQGDGQASAAAATGS